MLSNPAYLHQEVYARHAFFAAVMIIFAVASATVPRYKCRPPHYRILMTAGFAIYFLLAISFFPGGPTATWTYFVFAAVDGYEALR
jgi:FtsH-binding integral membrane protein